MRRSATLNLFILTFKLLVAGTVFAMNVTLAVGAFLIAWGVL